MPKSISTEDIIEAIFQLPPKDREEMIELLYGIVQMKDQYGDTASTQMLKLIVQAMQRGKETPPLAE